MAAAKAAAALAFDRAAFYYRQALALTPGSNMAETWKEGHALTLDEAVELALDS